MSIKCKAVLSNLAIGQTPTYRLVPQNSTKIDEGTFVEAVADKAGVSSSEARYWLDTILSQLVTDLSKNYNVTFGDFIAKLAVRGSLQSVNEQPNKLTNPVVVNIVCKGDTKEQIASLEVVNDTAVVPSVLQEVEQDGVGEKNKIVNTTDRIVANGSYIKIELNRTDEGIWLENMATGVKVASATVSYSDNAVAHFKFSTLPTTGQYTLVVATRGGMDETYAVNTLKRQVYVVNSTAA